MRKKRCPYCGKRFPYFSVFASRKKGEMECSRCHKNSKVHISKNILLIFAVFVLISLAVMTVFILTKLLYNPISIVLVSIPLIIFMFMTPMFVKYEPLKKYRPSMEARKAGIEYADNLTADEFEIKEPINMFVPAKKTVIEEPDINIQSTEFKINADVFNKIKAERNAARLGVESNSDNDKTRVVSTNENKNYVPVIKNVSENHASTGAGLKKIHSESEQYNIKRNIHYVSEHKNTESENLKDEKSRTNGNRYSANRKF